MAYNCLSNFFLIIFKERNQKSFEEIDQFMLLTETMHGPPTFKQNKHEMYTRLLGKG